MSISGERGTKSQQQDRRNKADHDRANPAGDRGTKSQQQDRRNMENARRAGNAAPGVGANRDRGTLSQQQDRINMNRSLARSNTAPGVGHFNDAMNDFNNVGQGFFDDPFGWLGRQLGAGFGVGEIDPTTQAPKSFLNRNTASWGVDPIGAALGLGGMFAGPAGTLASGLYNRGKGLFGWQGPMIAFDGNQPVTGGMPNFGGWGGGPLSPGQMAGGGTGNGGQGVMAPQTAGNPSGMGQPSQPQPGQQPGQQPAAMTQPNYPPFQWAQPWPGSQPTMGNPMSSWGIPQMPQQPQQQQPWSNGLMAPQQNPWARRMGHTTGWR